MAITPLPTAPSRSDPNDIFVARADAWVASLSTFVTETNATATTMTGQVTTAAGSATASANSATASANSATASAASAASAQANANATAWVSGATYASGVVVWSLIDFLPYRRSIAGAGVTDPKNDPTKWVAQVATNAQWTVITADPATAQVGSAYMCNTTAAAFTVTLPPTPAANAVVRLADYAGKFATNNLTVGRNGQNIMGLAQNMTVGTNNVSITLTYIDATQGWRIV